MKGSENEMKMKRFSRMIRIDEKPRKGSDDWYIYNGDGEAILKAYETKRKGGD